MSIDIDIIDRLEKTSNSEWISNEKVGGILSDIWRIRYAFEPFQDFRCRLRDVLGPPIFITTLESEESSHSAKARAAKD
jgi:hypothetical protein